MALRVEDVRLLLAAVDAGSITKAAQQSFISQQGLSAAIRRVEQFLGSEVLVRYPTGVRLTDSGRAAYESLRGLVSNADAAAQLARLEPEGGTTLVVGVTSPAGMGSITALYGLAPHIQVRVHQLNFDQVERVFAHKLADIVITFGPLAVPGWTSSLLYSEQLGLLVPRGHRLARAASIEPSAVLDEVFLAGSSLPRGWSEVGRLESFRDGRVARIGDPRHTDVHNPADANEMVAARLAVVTAPMSHGRFFPHPLATLVPLDGSAVSCDVVVLSGVLEEGTPKRAAADTVVTLLHALARNSEPPPQVRRG
jgi:DNA-binding transcriptional LysR family regulator